MPSVEIERWIGNRASADPSRNLLVLPGMQYPVGMPLLFMPALALADAGWTVWHATWDLTDLAGDDDALAAAVDAAAEDFLGRAAGTRVLLGKSLGTFGAAAAVRHVIPAVWLTPLLTVAPVATALSSGSGALLVGGTADPTWDSSVARELDAEVLEIPDGDHMLYAGDWHRYLHDLEAITEAVVALASRASDG